MSHLSGLLPPKNEYLPIDSEDFVNEGKPRKKNTYMRLGVVAGLTLGSLLGVLLFSINSVTSSASVEVYKAIFGDAQNTIKSSSDEDYFTFETLNPFYDTMTSDWTPWDYIAEPYKPITYQITEFYTVADGNIDVFTNNDVNVKWIIDGSTYIGQSINCTIEKTGGQLLTGEVTLTYKTTVYKSTFDIALKYIRREIRSLSDEDRNAWLIALKLMYTVDGETGRSNFGAKFVSAEELLYKHLNGAGRTDCDHWHDGAGVVTHHMAFTLEAEQSLQAIDPTLTMPYWEYAMDTYKYDEWYDSPIFDSDWLGSARPASHVMEGTFADALLPDGSKYDWNISAEGSLNPFQNAYGAMRSPWNNNPTKVIGRSNLTYGEATAMSFPNCVTMYDCYSKDTMAEMNDCLNGNTHGPVHILIGGAWGENTTQWDDTDVDFLRGTDKVLYFKMLWRAGFTRCPDSCDADKDAVNGVCVCAVPDEYITELTATYMLSYSGISSIMGLSDDEDNEELSIKIIRALEDPGIAGEMYTSAAPFDPTFWPLHGQIERMVGLKRIMVARGEATFDETWGYTTTNYRFLRGECDWSKVTSASDLTLPTCNMDSSYVCSGHNANDTLEWTDFINKGETYSNTDFYTFMDPWNEELPYAYDSYDFDYCETYDNIVF